MRKGLNRIYAAEIEQAAFPATQDWWHACLHLYEIQVPISSLNQTTLKPLKRKSLEVSDRRDARLTVGFLGLNQDESPQYTHVYGYGFILGRLYIK